METVHIRRPARILVVEDERLIAKEFVIQLERMGHVVPAVTDKGEEVLDLVTAHDIDLVLLDIALAGNVDGIAVGHALAQADVAHLYLTAYADQATLDRARLTTPFGYITKPFQERELFASIEIALYKHAVERERERMRQRLLAAEREVEDLQDLLPMCAWCKQIRDDQGYWQKVEHYLGRRGTTVTHGLCPRCALEIGGKRP